MKNIILLFILLIPAFLFAQYPATGNKQRLGYQTTGDGLIWRGVAADTVNKPNNRNYPYFQLDTVNAVLYRFIQTKQQWQPVTGGTDIDSLIYATRYWVSTNFFPLIGGTLTGTGGAGFIGFPSQVSAPGTPASGLNVYAQGSSFNWKGTDGYERQFASTITGGRTYTLPDVSGTFTLGTGTGDRSARWSATNTLAAGNFTDNGTKVQALLPFQLQQWTTAGRPTGVTGYEGYNTTGNGKEWYQGSRWAYALESTFARGTAGSIFFADANGQVTQNNSNFFWDNTNVRLGIATTAPEQKITFLGSGTNVIQFKATTGNTGVYGLYFNHSLGNNVNPAKLIVNPAGAFGRSTVGLWLSSGGDAVVGDANWIADYQQTTFNKPIVYNQDIFTIGDGVQTAGDPVEYKFAHAGAATTYIRSKALGAFNRGDMGFYTLDSLRMYISGFGGNVNVGQSETTNYKFSVLGTNAIGIPRGTVGNQPVIVSNTTPVRFFTDTAAIGYGDAGVYNFLATRAYARTMKDGNGIISALPAGNVSISTNTNTLTLNGSSLTLQNQGGFNAIRVKGSTGFEGTMIYGQRSFQYFTQLDDRIVFFPGHYNWKQAITWPGVFSGSAIEVDVFGLDTVNTTSRRVVGNYFSLLPYTHQFIVNTNVTANPTGLEILKSNATSTGVILSIKSSSPVFEHKFNADGTIEFDEYGTGTKEASDVSKTQSNYIAGFATDGTVLDLERKRDTTIFVTADTDYDWSAAITTAQVGARYNRVIIHMTLTSGATADKTTTLHTPDANLMQCEILIRGTDNTGTYDNEIAFGTNNAISSDGTNTSGYTLAQGQGLHVRVVYNGSAYKYIYY